MVPVTLSPAARSGSPKSSRSSDPGLGAKISATVAPIKAPAPRSANDPKNDSERSDLPRGKWTRG